MYFPIEKFNHFRGISIKCLIFHDVVLHTSGLSEKFHRDRQIHYESGLLSAEVIHFQCRHEIFT